MAEPREQITNAVKGQLVDPTLSDPKRLQNARVLSSCRVVVPVTIQANADSDYLVFYPQAACEIVNAKFVPCVALAESDTDNLSLNLSKGDLAAGSLTAMATAITTAATGQVGDLAARTAKTWTLSATQATRQLTADQGVYLVIDETGTGPGMTVSVILEVRWLD